MPVTEGRIPYGSYETWYRRQTADGVGAPLVVLHGGPGAAHNYCLPMSDMFAGDRDVILYDQLGCGNSTHRPDAPPEFWSIRLWLDELAQLVEALGLGNFHLLGQSWGGELAAEYAIANSDRLLSLTICDSPASNALWRSAADRLRGELPDDVRKTLERHEQDDTTDSAEYAAAVAFYTRRHVLRMDEDPPELAATYRQLDADPTVYNTTNGPYEFSANGTLRDWSVVGRLGAITTPTLVIAGAYDEAAPEVWQPFVDEIPDVRSEVFEHSSHLPHLEQPDDFARVVGAFLRAHD